MIKIEVNMIEININFTVQKNTIITNIINIIKIYKNINIKMISFNKMYK
jgi:hypothetical protein